MKRILFIVALLFFLINFGSPLTYKEINRQIDGEIYSKILVENETLSEDVFTLTDIGEGYAFLKKITFEGDYDYAEVYLVLDYGFYLSELGANPPNYNLETDGHLITLKWIFEDVKKGEGRTFFAVIEKKREDDFSLIIIGFFVLIFFLLLFFIYFFFFNKKRRDKIMFLLEDEKKIIGYLRKCQRNESWQKNIQKDLGFSKAKLSRLVRNLESRGLIKKIPFGNTNKIVLK